MRVQGYLGVLPLYILCSKRGIDSSCLLGFQRSTTPVALVAQRLNDMQTCRYAGQ